MAKQFYYKQMGEVLGPVSGQQLKQLADSGVIDGATHISTDRERWVLAEQVQGLFTASASADVVSDSPTRLFDSTPLATPEMMTLRSPLNPRPPQRPASTLPPRGLIARLIQLLDLRFERYLTPQLIRIFWVLSIVLAVVGVLISGLGGLPYAIPHRIQVENDIPFDTQQRTEVIRNLIQQKEREQTARTTQPNPQAEDFTPPMSRPSVGAASPVQDALAQYHALNSMSLEQLKAELARLEKEFPKFRSVWVVRNLVVYVLSCIASLVTSILGLLVVRIVCEMFVVVFNIAGHLCVIRDMMSKQSAPA